MSKSRWNSGMEPGFNTNRVDCLIYFDKLYVIYPSSNYKKHLATYMCIDLKVGSRLHLGSLTRHQKIQRDFCQRISITYIRFNTKKTKKFLCRSTPLTFFVKLAVSEIFPNPTCACLPNRYDIPVKNAIKFVNMINEQYSNKSKYSHANAKGALNAFVGGINRTGYEKQSFFSNSQQYHRKDFDL